MSLKIDGIKVNVESGRVIRSVCGNGYAILFDRLKGRRTAVTIGPYADESVANAKFESMPDEGKIDSSDYWKPHLEDAA